MVRNIKRYKKELHKAGKVEESKAFNFVPLTYNLPSDYTAFAEDFKNKNTFWIAKPVGKCQGRGIFLFNKLKEIAKWKDDIQWSSNK